MNAMNTLSGPRWRLAPVVAIGCVAVSGCVPYPVYKELRPSAVATVTDAAGAPLAGAEVTLISNSYPYGRERTRDTVRTDAGGKASFDGRREWRIEVLAIHGSEQFFWNWCVRKPGFATVNTNHRSAGDFAREPAFRMVAGVSAPCEPGPGSG